MPGIEEGGSDPKPSSSVLALDAICDAFEADWKRGGHPLIEKYLERADSRLRRKLFPELLGLEIEYRKDLGETPSRADYIGRFPGYEAEISAVFNGSNAEATTVSSFLARPAREDLVAGIDPDNRYRPGEEVARGGMGVIHLAEDLPLRRRVAIKTILDPGETSANLARFIEEAQITGQLDHPGIVPIYDVGTDDSGNVFYSMKYVRGQDLQAVLDGIRKGDVELVSDFPLHRLLTVFDHICDAVSFAHARGVIHRDLKPANIRIGEFGEVYVMDWGLARLSGKTWDEIGGEAVVSVRSADGSGALRTLDGAVVGSPLFMSPEQAAGQTEALDGRTDIYALGAILYAILTLKSPVSGENLDDILRAVTEGEIAPADQIYGTSFRERSHRLPHCPGNRIPEALSAVAMKAWLHVRPIATRR